ncbi:MAG TPA: apolipoprotein N-acyltransferase [Candidatus Lustribacter sp.]|nr:apolipoprotein N-acyltransferase [Candidatus Lustribacter sp.]
MHLAFPRTNAWWLIPFALAVMFRTWAALPLWTAAANGYLSGLVFFTLSFSWFGETAAALVGPLGFMIDLGPALGEALAFAFTALVAALAARRCAPALAPLVTAAAFTAAEWMRSSGIVGVPFGQLGLPLVDSPLRPIAAFAGGYGLTFVVAAVAAYAGASATVPRLRPAAAGALVAAIALTAAAWWAWPARTLAPPALRVAAIQGNIPQQIKATDAARLLAAQRYAAMTVAVAAQHPAFVVWPETVILTDMTRDNAARAAFGALARRVGTPIFVGTIVSDALGRYYNASMVFDRNGNVEGTIAKRQLVPFAEFLPGPSWLRAIPAINEIGDFTQGHGPQIDPLTHAGVLICWESVFGDIAIETVRAGAPFLIVATDDAWFGTSDGPYQHAQATTLRAVETGRWIVRAASTGISGIIAPDGSWRARSDLATQATIVGDIGAPIDVPYLHVGPQPLGLAALAFVVLALVPWRRRA